MLLKADGWLLVHKGTEAEPISPETMKPQACDLGLRIWLANEGESGHWNAELIV